MITNNPNLKRGNLAKTFLIILGVVIALYLSVSSGVLSADLSPSILSPFSKSLAQEEVVPDQADAQILLPVLKEASQKLVSALDLPK